jgi:D-alanine-D-alanine ligase
MNQKINLAVIFGGKSGEHEVSLKSASQVMEALDKEKYNVIPIAITKKGQWLIGEKGKEYMRLNLPKAQAEGGVAMSDSLALATIAETSLEKFSEGDTNGEKIDLVLPILHGPYGEDGKLQGMLETLGISFVFSGTLSSALAMNKKKTKIIARAAGLKIAKDEIIQKGKKYNPEKIAAKLNFPMVVKPLELGSSVGTTLANNAEELKTGIEKALACGGEAICEEFIKGRELTVAVMGNEKPKPLPVIEIVPKISGWFDYRAKYETGGSDEICPAEIPDDIRKKVQRYAVKIFKAVGCRDLARADFIWDKEKNRIIFLEINTIPGLTATSLTPKAARAAKMEFAEFIDKIIQGAIKRIKKS